MFKKSTAYKYNTLDVPKDEIRVLRILPGAPEEIIRCKLEHVTLNETASYEALSYTWHDSTLSPDENREERDAIEVDDQRIFVQGNLFSFLKTWRASHPDSPPLWIDALSINQGDIIERNAQVLRMRNIYRLARRVVVWLGPESEESDQAVEFLKFVCNNCPQGREAEWFTAFLQSSQVTAQWKALTRLLYRAWWGRIWIVQEVVLASDILVLCGDTSLKWRELEFGIHKITAALDGVWDKIPVPGGLSVVRNRVNSIAQLTTLRRRRNDLTTLDIIDNVGGNKCSDPRDKVLGLLGMMKDGPLLVPSPDYTRSPENTYRGFFVSLAIISGGSLDFLSLVNNNIDDSMSSTLPTWCPELRANDFRTIPRLNTSLILQPDSVPQFNASASSKSSIKASRDRNSIFLPAMTVDAVDGVFPGGFGNTLLLKYTVQARSSASPYGSDIATFTALWTSFVAGLNLASTSKDFSAPPQYGELFAKLCCATEEQHKKLCSEDVESMFNVAEPLNRPRFVSEDSTQSFATWYKYNRDVLVGGKPIKSWAAACIIDRRSTPTQTPPIPLAEEPFYNDFQDSWQRANTCRRLMITEKGYIGMVPELTRRGDLVCVLFGSRMPCILRPRNSYFLFIGECYVHGLMHGEAMADLKRGLYTAKEFEIR